MRRLVHIAQFLRKGCRGTVELGWKWFAKTLKLRLLGRVTALHWICTGSLAVTQSRRHYDYVQARCITVPKKQTRLGEGDAEDYDRPRAQDDSIEPSVLRRPFLAGARASDDRCHWHFTARGGDTGCQLPGRFGLQDFQRCKDRVNMFGDREGLQKRHSHCDDT